MQVNKTKTFQSPINIHRQDTNKIHCLDMWLEICYNVIRYSTLTNTGQTWELNTTNRHLLYITGGPLADNLFQLHHIECRWGNLNTNGSEHHIDSLPYSGELHFVHWNESKYRSIEDASNYVDGIVIIAVFLHLSEYDNVELNKITKLLRLIEYKNDELTLPYEMNPLALLPESLLFYCYDGSFTKSPFNESVTWLIMKKSIDVSIKQLEEMRQMRKKTIKTDQDEDHFIYSNIRKPRRLHNRTVFEYIDY